MQGLFARVGSGDPVRVLRLFHNNYTGYCCIHLLCITTYNLSLPRLSATSTTGCLRLCNSGLLTRTDVHGSVSRGQLLSGTVLYLPRTVSLWDHSRTACHAGFSLGPLASFAFRLRSCGHLPHDVGVTIEGCSALSCCRLLSANFPLKYKT